VIIGLKVLWCRRQRWEETFAAMMTVPRTDVGNRLLLMSVRFTGTAAVTFGQSLQLIAN